MRALEPASRSKAVFGLTISQGALMNMFARTARAFDEKKGQALAVLRKASFVASDEKI
jgi:transposase